ncbi:MAG: DUF1302 family protein [bacterium]
MRISRFIVSILLILCSNSVKAQELEVGGFVEIDHISYVKNGDDNKVNSRNQGIVQLELRSSLGEQSAIFSAIEFREDQSDPSRSRIYLDETYIDLYLGNFDFRFGKQIIVWGKADAINPTDNLTPWDFSDYLDTDDERIGVVALKANYYVGDWTFEGILAPTFTHSVLPSQNSRWFPDFPTEVPNPMFPQAGPPMLKASFEFLDAIVPDEGIANAQYAAKLSTTLSGWDISASYFSGWDDLPTFHQTQLLRSDSLSITIQPRYHRLKAVGADFSTAIGKWGLRGEAAYFITEDAPGVDDSYFQYVLGIDRTFSDFIGDHNLFVLAQWVQELPQVKPAGRSSELKHIFQKSMTARMEYELSNFSKVSLEGVVNMKNKDYYLRPEFSYEIADGVKLNVSADILGGHRNSFFGAFRDNKRVQVKVKYSF